MFLVLPFAGLDIVLFAYFMFKVNREGLHKQLIIIDSQKVLIESGITKIEDSLSFVRADAFLIVSEQQNKKGLGLKISDSKSFCDIGSFLSTSDKIETRQALNDAGLREISEQWWQSPR